jgi:hypothetical protein
MMRPKETNLPHHPECFVCDVCGDKIGGKYYNIEGKVVCSEDYRVR